MAFFKVTQIVDGDTFDVSPGWAWNGHQGNRVRPAGYDTPELGTPFSALATARLRQLIGGKTVELGKGYTIDRGRLVCEVIVNGRNLSAYFPRYRV